ncbi:hypothetical protein VCSRO67_2461 [Vibrio cholerae]|nr:hypothetical protein VCSRO67_2461 [Vibrio cholerae]
MTFREKKENPGGKPTGVRVLLAAFQLLKGAPCIKSLIVRCNPSAQSLHRLPSGVLCHPLHSQSS